MEICNKKITELSLVTDKISVLCCNSSRFLYINKYIIVWSTSFMSSPCSIVGTPSSYIKERSLHLGHIQQLSNQILNKQKQKLWSQKLNYSGL